MNRLLCGIRKVNNNTGIFVLTFVAFLALCNVTEYEYMIPCVLIYLVTLSDKLMDMYMVSSRNQDSKSTAAFLRYHALPVKKFYECIAYRMLGLMLVLFFILKGVSILWKCDAYVACFIPALVIPWLIYFVRIAWFSYLLSHEKMLFIKVVSKIWNTVFGFVKKIDIFIGMILLVVYAKGGMRDVTFIPGNCEAFKSYYYSLSFVSLIILIIFACTYIFVFKSDKRNFILSIIGVVFILTIFINSYTSRNYYTCFYRNNIETVWAGEKKDYYYDDIKEYSVLKDGKDVQIILVMKDGRRIEVFGNDSTFSAWHERDFEDDRAYAKYLVQVFDNHNIKGYIESGSFD